MSIENSLSDEMFTDAISEILNIGMGQAAASLSEMVEEEVMLSVPYVEFVTRQEAADNIAKQAKSDVSGVRQHFEGAFTGDAMLLFPEQQSLELVRAVIKEDISLEDLSEMEQDAMAEIGNVILNACLSSMADIFSNKMTGDVPEFVRGSLNKVFSDKGDDLVCNVVLFLKMEFAISKKNIQGYVSFLMDVESVQLFKQNIEKYLGIS